MSQIGNWLVSHDTGLSSETMAAIALGTTKRRGLHAPHDPGDFGRCYRLVKAVPEVRNAFPRIAKMVKPFAGIVREWDALCEIYERDLPTGRSDELYRRIKELRGDEGAA
ncbi:MULTISPECIES: hypothetical protein [unclassified Burkholderia]|uniref:hypothetical protein n=1 Tax=unclassified Burkholderia TaxID=2613784 RepID=UPI000F569FA5|nr:MULTISPECIES: hypothetical protein [unclassified Burkholderia]